MTFSEMEVLGGWKQNRTYLLIIWTQLQQNVPQKMNIEKSLVCSYYIIHKRDMQILNKPRASWHSGKSNSTHNRRKEGKAILTKLKFLPMSGLKRVVMRCTENMLITIKEPDVYRLPNTDTSSLEILVCKNVLNKDKSILLES